MTSQRISKFDRHQETQARTELGGWALWWRWTVATATGELLGFAAPATLAPLAAWVMTERLGTVPGGAMMAVAVVAGVVEGAVLGFAQWLVLRRAVRSMAWQEWVLVTALAAGVAYILGMTPSTLADSTTLSPIVFVGIWIVLGALLVTSIGFGQWLVLRRYIRKSGWWVLANALAWPLGVAIPIVGMMMVPDGSPVWLWVVVGIASGVLMGAVVGSITGVAMAWLLRPRSS